MKQFIIIFFISLIFPAMAIADDRGVTVVGKTGDSQRRVALVIGNANYQSSPLRNPVNDAEDTASALKSLGFEVTLGTDMTRKEMRRVIRAFGESLKQGGVGLFYFAGHGMQVEGKNFLIPVGADITAEFEVQDEAVDAGTVLRSMDAAGNTMNMVFMDACRDNPFARSFRSNQKGLAQMDAPSGSLIVYATAPGSVAADGDGRNGVFTQNLLAHISTPGLPISEMMMQVRTDVRRKTNNLQTPWESSSLEGNFYFAPSSETAKLTPRPVPAQPPVQVQPSSPGELSLDEKIKSALRRKKEIERKYSKLQQMAALDDSMISTDEKIKMLKGFLESYPDKNHKLEDANRLLAKLEIGTDFSKTEKAVQGALSIETKIEGWKTFISKYGEFKSHKTMDQARTQLASLNREKLNQSAPKGMVGIPRGEFLAGADPSEGYKECLAQEEPIIRKGCKLETWVIDGPEHTISVEEFFIDIYEVTQSQYERVMGENPSEHSGANYPVDSVTWHQAKAYCQKIGKRLPTEWEWEKSARGGKTTVYYWGNQYDQAYAWTSINSGDKPHPVGQKKPNKYGLYDTAGNAWEWTGGNNDSNKKRLRGGSWAFYPPLARPASRFNFGKGKIGFHSYGFRCAYDTDSPPPREVKLAPQAKPKATPKLQEYLFGDDYN